MGRHRGKARLRLYMNGEERDDGTEVEVDPDKFEDMDDLLDFFSDEARELFGQREKFTRLYTVKGDKVRDLRDLNDGEEYVLASGRFVRLDYGDLKRDRGRSRRRSRRKSKSSSRSKSGSRKSSRSSSRGGRRRRRAKSHKHHRRDHSRSPSPDDRKDRRRRRRRRHHSR